MRVLTRYILKEFFSIFFTASFILVGIFLVGNAFDFAAKLIAGGAGFFNILKIFLLGIPSSFVFVIPVAFLIGWLATLSRLSAQSEIIAIQSSGVNPNFFLKSIFLTTLLTCAFLLYSNSFLAPKSNLNMNQEIKKIISEGFLKIEPETFSKFGNFVFYVGKKDNENLYNINIFENNEKNRIKTKIFAKKGKIQKDQNQKITILLEDGIMISYENALKDIIKIKFKKYIFGITGEDKREEEMELSTFTTEKLFKMLKKNRKDEKKSRVILTEIHTRFVLGLTPLFLILPGVFLSIRVKNPKRIVGMGIALLLVGVYYFIFTVFFNLVENRILTPEIGLWIPGIFMVILGFFFREKR
ncbi:MAG: LptF/LptG family permease [Elusimicrobia bacterium]|nr:LptF/LptG family permease [Elusimicrobiota bacterium]